MGCGDGQLTFQIHQSSLTTGRICGLDASERMIAAAQAKYPHQTHPNLDFHVQDCARFNEDAQQTYLTGQWDKVFSNAAMHWILRDPETRAPFFDNVHRALRPGGVFVFEQGGFGNVAEVHAALIATMMAHGWPAEQARDASPWFFPTDDWMRDALERAGFEVEKLELEYRPTRLTADDDMGNGGLEGWVRIFGADFIDRVMEVDDFICRVADILESIITRPEDGSKCIGYVRLRGVARKRL